jgi:hypothetical protein
MTTAIQTETVPSLDTQPDAAVMAGQRLAYRRLAASILGLDVRSAGESLQARRTESVHPVLATRCPSRKAAVR